MRHSKLDALRTRAAVTSALLFGGFTTVSSASAGAPVWKAHPPLCLSGWNMFFAARSSFSLLSLALFAKSEACFRANASPGCSLAAAAASSAARRSSSVVFASAQPRERQ